MPDLHLPWAVYCLQKLPEPTGLGSCVVAHKLQGGYKQCRRAPFTQQTNKYCTKVAGTIPSSLSQMLCTLARPRLICLVCRRSSRANTGG